MNKNTASRLNRYICPALLGASVCFAVIYTLYRPMCVLYTVIFFAAELLLFTLFDKLKTKRIIGGAIYLAILTLVFVLSFRMLFAGAVSYGTIILSWFYGDEGSYVNLPLYLNAVFLFGGYFVISILFYFTQVRYRSLGVMLSILFPFVIYAKRAEEIPEVLVTIIITLYIAVMVHNRRIDPAVTAEKRGKLKVDLSYIISIAIFVSVTGAVTMMIEKPEYQSKLERDSNYFNAVDTNATGAGDDGSLSQTSSRRYGTSQPSSDPLFYFSTQGNAANYFLRRQSFDYFNGNVWDNEEPFGESTSDEYGELLTPNNPEYTYNDIYADMSRLGYYDAGSESSFVARSQARVYDESYAPMYLPAPYGAIIDEVDYSESDYNKYPHGEIYRRAYNRGSDPQPLDDTFEFYEPTEQYYDALYAAALDGNEFSKKLENDILNDSFTDDADKQAAQRLYDDYTHARTNYGERYAYVDDRVTQLAYSITEGMNGDYAKAKALENYFEANGYIYDLEFVPEDESIEAFIFDNKTGTCSNYATAMTLMARSIGLPARYVEGYAAFEKTDEDTFLIRGSYAHAWTEVYIAGAGWVTFDPTVSGYMQIPQQNFDTNTFLMVLGRFLIVIIVVFAIVFILLLDRIIEMIFRLRLRFKAPAAKTLMLYANIIKLANFSAKADFSAYTVKMLRQYLLDSRGVCPNLILDLFEKTCFGGYQPTDEEFSAAYTEYKNCYKYLRKIPKSDKLEKIKAQGAFV